MRLLVFKIRYIVTIGSSTFFTYFQRTLRERHIIQYPKPAYFSFTYPKPTGFELAKITPNVAQWNNTLGEFILEYEQVKNATHPEAMLLAFFESAYQAGTDLAGWDPTLIHSGKPI